MLLLFEARAADASIAAKTENEFRPVSKNFSEAKANAMRSM